MENNFTQNQFSAKFNTAKTDNDLQQLAANLTNTDDQSPEWILEKIVDFMSFYYIPALVLTGSIGNILSVLVFFRTKLKKLSSSHYLAALGISDTCFLLLVLVNWLNVVGLSLSNQYIVCEVYIYLTGVCSFLSVWFVVAFTVERFIAVLYPLKRQTMCTVRRAKTVLCGLTIVGALHSSPLLVFFSVVYSEKMNSTLCDMKSEYKNPMQIFNYYDTVVVFVVPFTAIVILNSFTGYTVWKVADNRRTMTGHRRGISSVHERRHNNISTSKCTHPFGNHSIRQTCPNSSRQRITNSSQMKVTKMLLIVSTVFVCLNLPSYVIRVRTYLEQGGSSRMTILIQYFCQFFFLTNFGINFVLYCLSGQNFRKAVVTMFRKGGAHRQEINNTQQTVSECIRSSSSNASRKRTVTRNGSWNDVHELCIMSSTKRG